MALVRINWKPSPKELRKFGLTMIVGFALIGLGFQFLPSPPRMAAAWTCYAFGAAAGLLGLTGARAALPVYLLWMGVAFVMGNLIGRVLLALVYYGLFTPMGLVMRLAGRDRLQLRRTRGGTYWRGITQPSDPARYERQF